MGIFGSGKKHFSTKNNNNNSSSSGISSSLSFSSLTPTSSNKSLQNVSLTNPLSSSPSLSQQNNVKLSINIESPPIVLYGSPGESSGSLLSGLLQLEILYKQSALNSSSANSALALVRSNPAFSQNDTLTVRSVTLALTQVVHYAKPFLPPSSTLQSCSDCKLKKTELARWDILTEPTEFLRGTSHGYPFSHLIPGSLPQTTSLSNMNMIIDYELVAKVVIARGKKSDEVLRISLPIIVKRSILRGPDRNSVRIFPPTELTASLVLPNVLYPKSTFPIELKLENVATSERRWRMRKLNWRLEENIKVKLNSCGLHKFKLRVVEEHTRRTNLHLIPPLQKKKNSSQVTTSFQPPPESANVTTPPPPPQEDLLAQTSNTGVSPVQTLTPETPRNGLDELLDNDAPQRPIQSDTNREEGNPVPETEDLTIPEPPKQEHALYLEETRTITHGEIKSGWKSDFSNNGRIELVSDINLSSLSTIGLSSSLNNLTSIDSTNYTSPLYNIKNLMNTLSSTCSCDLFDDTLGIYVSHLLVVELVVAEELLQGSNCSNNTLKPQKSKESRLAEVSPLFANVNQAPKLSLSGTSSKDQSTGGKSPDNKVGIPTGAARVLRMQFKVILTERSGLGIAWDDEVPPTYQDVRLLSPPTYDQTLNVSQLDGLDETPLLGLLSFPPPAALSQTHRTPGVLYGGGDTPGANFSNFDLNSANAEELENFLDLRI